LDRPARDAPGLPGRELQHERDSGGDLRAPPHGELPARAREGADGARSDLVRGPRAPGPRAQGPPDHRRTAAAVAKLLTSSPYSRACVRWGRCPAPSIVWISAFGSASARASAIARKNGAPPLPTEIITGRSNDARLAVSMESAVASAISSRHAWPFARKPSRSSSESQSQAPSPREDSANAFGSRSSLLGPPPRGAPPRTPGTAGSCRERLLSRSGREVARRSATE